MQTEDKIIHLALSEREKLAKKAICPNCRNDSFKMVLAERKTMKNHPFETFRKGRPIYQCAKCGYWTDWFDGWVWKPKEMLRE